MTDIEYSRNERSISSWISMGSIDAGVDRLVGARSPRVAVAARAWPCAA